MVEGLRVASPKTKGNSREKMRIQKLGGKLARLRRLTFKVTCGALVHIAVILVIFWIVLLLLVVLYSVCYCYYYDDYYC